MKQSAILYRELTESYRDNRKSNARTSRKAIDLSPLLKAAAEELPGHAGTDGRLKAQDILDVWDRYIYQAAAGDEGTRPAPEDGWLLQTYQYLRNRLFPHISAPKDQADYAAGRESLLRFFRAVYRYERKTCRFDPTKDMIFLSDQEVDREGFTAEYKKMKKVVRRNYIYEFMRIGIDITPFNTLGHISGVHYVAMCMAGQLYAAGVPVDLALISGAAASHDIGKYGCRKHEENRVPYLHYYYTDYCLNKFGLPGIAHIAANHSTWDLELENLPVESLLLIYADFRTKSTRGDGREIIHFYTLKEAFDVILNKLDNVDEAKRERYVRVYSKMKDFEDYMREKGVDPAIAPVGEDGKAGEYAAGEGILYDPGTRSEVVPVRLETAFLSGKRIVDQMKNRAIDHNIRVMSRFNNSEDFGSLIEDARSETRWKNARTYLNILNEYSTYMTDEQKTMTLDFLYEMLPHHENDIREQTARVMGKIVGRYRMEYKKELPADIPAPDENASNVSMFAKYIELFLFPNYKYTEQHKRWITSSADFFVRAVVANCRPSCRHKYYEILERYYEIDNTDELWIIELLSTALNARPEFCPDSYVRTAVTYARRMLGSYGMRVDLIALDVLEHFDPSRRIEAERRRRRILNLGPDGLTEKKLSAMFLDDLKTQTHWVVKMANIREMLASVSSDTGRKRLMHIATHFVNLIKVSETVTVRKSAGSALLSILKMMTMDQRNELMVELSNGLETEDYQFSRFIPDYLGVVLMHLPSREIDETIESLQKYIDAGNESTASAALDTIAIAIENYDLYADDGRGGENNERMERMLGMLMKGFAYYKHAISREAFRTMGEHLFASPSLTLKQKHDIAVHAFKRILTIMPETAEDHELDFYNNAAVLNHIYRFISEYQNSEGDFTFKEAERVAFFPGTFDPFSLGHKAIATTIRDMGFEVYLAIDEFSWSKKTLPHLLRREILGMSIADEEGLYIFPDDRSINIANPADLKELKSLFAGRTLYVAVGSDVIKNASSYKKKPEPYSIHSFNHLVFAREAEQIDEDTGDHYPVTGDVIELTLQKYYEDISSTRIRENIDLGRDISSLLDPIVQNYIYDRNFYAREPAYKHVLQAREMTILIYNPGERCDVGPIRDELRAAGYEFSKVTDFMSHREARKVLIETGEGERRLSAVAAARRLKTQELLGEFEDPEVAAYIRKNCGGGIALIGAFYAAPKTEISNLSQILLTELLAMMLARDYTFAVYHPVCSAGMDPGIIRALKEQGFVNISPDEHKPIYAVSMRDPIAIFRDVETVVKAPLNKNPRVQKALDAAHEKLLKTFRKIYPGRLLISFNTSAVHNKIAELVARDNGVSTVPDPLRRRGPYLSVPFGKALADVVGPNTVTKAFRTEKYFLNDLSGFTIREPVDYQPLRDQARVLRSFDRPVILIDDLLHSGQRMNQIDPILREQNVEVHKVIVGLLTGNAMDNMTARGRDVEGAYFIPSIGMWLNERDCYPFLGGDGIDGPEGDDTVSINLTMPYTSFSFVGGNDPDSIYEYSLTCLENALSILKVLEQEYQREFEKKLTLHRLGAVLMYPRRPLLGGGLGYDEQVAPSVYVENDIRWLKRLHLKRGVRGMGN